MIKKRMAISMISAVLVAGMLTLILVTTKPLSNQAFAVPFKCPDTRLTISVNPGSGSVVREGETAKLSGNLSCGLNHAGVGGATIHLRLSGLSGSAITDSSGDYHTSTEVGIKPAPFVGIVLQEGGVVKLQAEYYGDTGNHLIRGPAGPIGPRIYEPATAEITVHYTLQK
ncbi:MAG: hypothetical protein WBZ36_29650 [Candidatus Nitrosopolaris sp.]